MNTDNRARTRALAALVAIAALALSNVGAAAAAPGGVPAIPLNTEQEVTGSNTGASGFFSYTISGSQLCYTLQARELSGPAGAAHIHLAPRHTAGPVVIPLTVGSGTSWTVETCTTADAGLLAAVAANPRAYYVNVHTAAFPGGEIRGQLK
ncbi:CHRD domain-containing protein [Pseudarthrobacter sp. N5]|uniref:CHRD domain-containing protein n=1 Tax=Pseudarthrobacter sp. N5 TaxID=3418416 RepID=UPI003CED8E21